MSVLTFVSFVRAHPVETIQVLLYSFNKVLASDYSVRYLAKLGSGVLVNIDTGSLGFCERHIVRVLALFTLFTNTSLEESAKSPL